MSTPVPQVSDVLESFEPSLSFLPAIVIAELNAPETLREARWLLRRRSLRYRLRFALSLFR
jgi:hypothetical protein